MQKAKIPPILLMATFFISDSVLLGTNSSPIAVAINTYLPLALCAVLMIKCILLQSRLNGRLLLFTLVFILTMALSAIVNSGFATLFSLMAKAVTIMLCYFICECYDFNSYVHAFEKCVFVIAVFSLVVYAICFISFDLIRLFPITYNTSNFPLYNLGLTVVPQSFLLQNYRNYGLFREPGVYQMYLAIALFIQLFKREKPQSLKILVYIAAIITTLSTTGFVVMLFLLAAFMLNRINKKESKPKKYYRITVLIVLLLSVIALIIYFDIFDISTRVFTKILSDNPNQLDIARKASIVSNMLIWLKHPIFGAGEAAILQLFTETTARIFGRFAVYNTNTLLFMFACYGTLCGAMFTIGMIGFSRKIGNTRYSTLVFFIMMVLLYVGENLHVSLLPYTIMFFGIQKLFERPDKNVINNGNGEKRDEDSVGV